ncbi:DHH family phosphoesterase [Salipaludibacillus aurantiacus]|uniref:Phosphoesterase RecJ domain-containing protein n=1 Tax=Salipaludibacillus aurantiacus TaxID=1601833 RepID=A0A1H9WPI9_9BACI|nr:bifunctional oligoribonuclease/PAP phosphatase NrnA [Salipaludibacillus aurantiacus]SES35820.1 phosphoesterase RecJ domain-containing protein [Salipaludibacillus aurantiacus]
MKQDILNKIKLWDSIIIHRHVRPDPDAIGSQAGLKALIKSLYPDKKVYLAGEEESSLAFLASMDKIEDSLFAKSLVIICDTANTARIDDERYRNGAETIKIDHHPNVDPYGNLMWVDPSASSTSEMIFELFEEAEKEGFVMDKEMARLLYAGIVADTGRFRFPNTTEKTFFAAGRLIEAEFSRPELYDYLYETSLSLLRLEGYVLSEVKITPAGAGYVYLTKDILDKYKVTSKEAASIVNSFSTLKGLKAWVFFVEEEDVIRVRLRSKGPEIHELAARYNGGGHPMASGASLSDWSETEKVLSELEDLCR